MAAHFSNLVSQRYSILSIVNIHACKFLSLAGCISLHSSALFTTNSILLCPVHHSFAQESPPATMDDFDIEMGDAVDVPMDEPQVEDIALGDDQQVSYPLPLGTTFLYDLTTRLSRRMEKSRSL